MATPLQTFVAGTLSWTGAGLLYHLTTMKKEHDDFNKRIREMRLQQLELGLKTLEQMREIRSEIQTIRPGNETKVENILELTYRIDSMFLDSPLDGYDIY